MTNDGVAARMKEAAKARRAAEKKAVEDFERAVVVELKAGAKPGEIADATDYSYETIRRIARAYNVRRFREPTVTSRKKRHGG